MAYTLFKNLNSFRPLFSNHSLNTNTWNTLEDFRIFCNTPFAPSVFSTTGDPKGNLGARTPDDTRTVPMVILYNLSQKHEFQEELVSQPDKSVFSKKKKGENSGRLTSMSLLALYEPLLQKSSPSNDTPRTV